MPGRRRRAQALAACLVAWQQVIERGYEGYVAKDEASAYESGAPRRWLKVKQKDWTIGDERWTLRISVAPRPVRLT